MISVVMPAYNAEKFIEPAIQSILDQTYRDFELIVVDDGSTDHTVNIIKEYVEKDDRVKLIQNSHGGACKARNDAITVAQYPWIAPMDADDIALPHRFERTLQAALADPDVVLWGSYMYQINTEGKIIGKMQVGPTSKDAFYAVDRSKVMIAVNNSSAMFKKEAVEKVGAYDVRLSAAQDLELWDRLADCGPIVIIPEALGKYRLHGSSITANRFYDQRMYIRFIPERYKARQEGRELTMEAFVEDYKNRPPIERLRRYLFDRGMFQYRNAGVLISQKKYFSAIISLMGAFIASPRFTLSRVFNRFFQRQN